MSMTVSAATVTAVSASISTPVRSAVVTVALMATWSSQISRSTWQPCTPMVCANGSRSGTFFVAAMPATRATANTSPLGTVPSRSAASTWGEHATSPRAVAVRTVGCFADTSTMWAAPDSVKCVNFMS